MFGWADIDEGGVMPCKPIVGGSCGSIDQGQPRSELLHWCRFTTTCDAKPNSFEGLSTYVTRCYSGNLFSSLWNQKKKKKKKKEKKQLACVVGLPLDHSSPMNVDRLPVTVVVDLSGGKK